MNQMIRLLVVFSLLVFSWGGASQAEANCRKANLLLSKLKVQQKKARAAVAAFKKAKKKALKYKALYKTYKKSARVQQKKAIGLLKLYKIYRRKARTASQKRYLKRLYKSFIKARRAAARSRRLARKYRALGLRALRFARLVGKRAKVEVAKTKALVKLLFAFAKRCKKLKGKTSRKRNCRVFRKKFRKCVKKNGRKKCKWIRKKIRRCSFRRVANGGYNWSWASLDSRSSLSLESTLKKELSGNWFEIDM